MLNTKKNLTIWAGGTILFLLALIWGLSGWNRIEKIGVRESESKENRKKQATQTVGSNLTNKVPKLVVKEGVHRDFGSVREGTNPHVFFTLINIGNSEAHISINDLSKGGCTAVSLIPELAPGDSARLELIFETLGYGGRSPNRRIQIHYNNPDLSPLELSVSARILPVEPYQAPIGELWYNFFVLIDVRSPEAFAKEHIVGSINVPLKELIDWTSNLPKYLSIYLISEEGKESDAAAQMLRKKGFSECVSVVGGLKEWRRRYSKKEFLISGYR